ncbi:MAG: hypothetical protein ACR2K5_14925 [Pseudolabrys sp.]
MSQVAAEDGRTARQAPASGLFWRGFEVTVGADRRAIELEWKALESLNTASVFQSYTFVDAWC